MRKLNKTDLTNVNAAGSLAEISELRLTLEPSVLNLLSEVEANLSKESKSSSRIPSINNNVIERLRSGFDLSDLF